MPLNRMANRVPATKATKPVPVMSHIGAASHTAGPEAEQADNGGVYDTLRGNRTKRLRQTDLLAAPDRGGAESFAEPRGENHVPEITD